MSYQNQRQRKRQRQRLLLLRQQNNQNNYQQQHQHQNQLLRTHETSSSSSSSSSLNIFNTKQKTQKLCQFSCQQRRRHHQNQHNQQGRRKQQHQHHHHYPQNNYQHQNQHHLLQHHHNHRHRRYTQRQQHHPQHQYQQHRSYHHQYHFWCLLHVILCLIDITSSLTMTEVKIPNHIMRFKSAALGCRYSLDGESLYSVKWYKDGHEFYRYVPRDKPPGQVFPLPGVNVDLRNSTDTQVVLRRVTLMSTGLYRCEVSGEAPAFNTVSESETMTVVVTPTHGPKITGGQPRYQIGDVVRVNCSSAPSKPICHLSWLINGEPANRSYLKQYDKLIVGREGLEVARLGLEFRVRGYHFKHGDMKLKCVAKISSLYWQSNEESVESDRQHRAPVLESRDSVAAKSHAHGTSAACSHPMTTTMQIIYMATLLHLTLAFSSCSTFLSSTNR